MDDQRSDHRSDHRNDVLEPEATLERLKPGGPWKLIFKWPDGIESNADACASNIRTLVDSYRDCEFFWRNFATGKDTKLPVTRPVRDSNDPPKGADQSKYRRWWYSLGKGLNQKVPEFELGRTVADLPAVKDYLDCHGAKMTGVWRASIVDEDNRAGYRNTTATIEFSKDGKVNVRPGYGSKLAHQFRPTKEQAEAIAAAVKAEGNKLPRTTTIRSLPSELENIDDDHLFVARDRTGKKIICAQLRLDVMSIPRPGVDAPKRDKEYRVYSPLNTGGWAQIYPDEGLPLFGLETLKNAAFVMVHEGAKAAQAARRAANNPKHPLYEDLHSYVHVGWIGGALNPSATDWSPLKDVQGRIVIVPDKDKPGKAAVAKISKLLTGAKSEVLSVLWPNYFPGYFDLADEIPEQAIKERFTIEAALQSATWGTVRLNWDQPNKRPIYAARKTFAEQWAYAATEKLFVQRRNPNVRYSAAQFNSKLRPFCDNSVRDFNELVLDAMERTYHAMTYLPGERSGSEGAGGDEERINIYVGARIREIKCEVEQLKPWFEFLEHLIPNEGERLHSMDWLATLIARPQQRAGHGMLLVNPTEGAAGKGTLIWILTPLLGKHNVSNPSADMIVDGQFNGWIAYKTLVHCAEVYQGHRWKATQKLKDKITEDIVEVNIKNVPASDHPNFAWFILASNNPLALRIEQNDRRWFIPTVGDIAWPREKWVALREWAVSGGLGRILWWARNYEKINGRMYLAPGMKTPMTERKAMMIENSEDETVKDALDFLDYVAAKLLMQRDEVKMFTLPPDEKTAERRAALQAEVSFTFDLKQLKGITDESVDQKQRLTPNQFAQRLASYNVVDFGTRIRLGGSSDNKSTVMCWGKIPENAHKARSSIAILTGYQVQRRSEEEAAAREYHRSGK